MNEQLLLYLFTGAWLYSLVPVANIFYYESRGVKSRWLSRLSFLEWDLWAKMTRLARFFHEKVAWAAHVIRREARWLYRDTLRWLILRAERWVVFLKNTLEACEK